LRVVTERSKVAMPETNIGLFPDVGGGYFLPKCPGFIGEYLGLTGKVLTGQQALAANLADFAINSDGLASYLELTCHKTSAQQESESFNPLVADLDNLATDLLALMDGDRIDA